MYDLKCGQRDCRYNHGYSCCARDIAVSQGTACTPTKSRAPTSRPKRRRNLPSPTTRSTPR
ncbi:MAG: DUF1540 domain-containing protein [Clostridiales bacterium]|nr:DUF1540 domain-containing protein [Clostridiales bacterium]